MDYIDYIDYMDYMGDYIDYMGFGLRLFYVIPIRSYVIPVKTGSQQHENTGSQQHENTGIQKHAHSGFPPAREWEGEAREGQHL